jgi:hypothetical protein
MELSVWLQIINVVLCECWSVLELRIIKCKSTESCLWTSFMLDMWMTCFPARPLLWLVISPTRRSPKKHKAPLYDLLFYIAYMSHTGLSASTITTYISGISTMHKVNGHTDNTKSFLVTKILEGSKRKNSPKGDLRLPVSMNLLKRLIQSLPFVCTSVYESTMFASAFSLCFFGLLRVDEITSQSKGRGGKHVIHISDIKLVRKQDSVDLHFPLWTLEYFGSQKRFRIVRVII